MIRADAVDVANRLAAGLPAAAPPKIRAKAKRARRIPATQLTLKHLRKIGYPLVQVVEKWNPHARVTQDMFGIIDVIAVSETDIMAVQTTSRTNFASRMTKVVESDALPILLKAGIRVAVHGWAKNAKGRWELREVEL